jgi:predicted transcriptional regulator
LSVNPALVRKIDALAKRQHVSRSALFMMAVTSFIERQQPAPESAAGMTAGMHRIDSAYAR